MSEIQAPSTEALSASYVMTAPNAKEEELFNGARRIDEPDARRLYIQQACGEDRQLQARVEALLRVCDEERSFLQSPPEGITVVEQGAIGEGAGTQVGPYQLVEQIGEGGFGIVFL